MKLSSPKFSLHATLLTLLAAAVLSFGAGALAAEAGQVNRHVDTQLPNGANVVFDLPTNWNGTVLLFSRGYSAGPNNPARNVARNEKDWLLAHGYALIGSSYSKTGWSVEEAVPDQLATLDLFIQQFGKPKRSIAWGSSMGGLVTMAMMERHPEKIDGGLVMCASVGGTLGMMNAALDGAFVFKTLQAPGSTLPVLFDGAGEQGKQDFAAWKQQVDAAQATPAGRARIALAATLAQVPPWIDRALAQPAAEDIAGQQRQLAMGLLGGILLPREDQHLRAGGNFSWNTGIDYASLLQRSGRDAFIRALYQEAGLNLDDELRLLATAPRVAGKPAAVDYMKKNYVPNGQLRSPMLIVQAVADPVTMVEMSGDYANLLRQSGKTELVREAYLNRTGHCNFTQAETLASLQAVEKRIVQGTWGEGANDLSAPAAMNALANSYALDGALFTSFTPAPFLRACSTRTPFCTGEPGAEKRVSAPGQYQGFANADYSDVVRSAQYVKGTDGTRLAIDIYRPAQGNRVATEKLPVILIHMTGQRRNPDPVKHAARMAQLGLPGLLKRGYVIAWMEPRGVGASYGSSNGFITPSMAADVHTVIEWLAVQSWSSGKIGMLGTSNAGFIQSMAATTVPPHLAALAPGVANPNFYAQLYPNGVSAVGGAGSPAARQSAEPVVKPVLPLLQMGSPVDEDVAPDYPLLKAALAEHASNFGMREEWLVNMHRDTFNPKVGYAPGLSSVAIEAADKIKAAKIPTYQMAGWFDSSPSGQLAAYKLWGNKIVVGAWVHGILNQDQGGPMLTVEYQRWFDQVLKGIDNGILSEPPVYYQTIHAADSDSWRFAADWPLPSQKMTPFYFDGGKSATVASVNDGQLSTNKKSIKTGEDRYLVNYDVLAFDGKFDRLARQWDGDMAPGFDVKGLTYTSAPLSADMEMTGHPVAHLWVKSSAPDANFIVTISDVDADGKSHFVTEGVMRGAHRKLTPRSPWTEMSLPYHSSLSADDMPLSSTQAVELAFEVNPISIIFRQGHRIRITLTGAEKLNFQLPPNATEASPPTIGVIRGSQHASYVALPLIPAKSARYQGSAEIATAFLTYKGPARFYPAANSSYLQLGEQWIICRTGLIKPSPLKPKYVCDSPLGQLTIALSSIDAMPQIRLRGKGVQFEGQGY